jgi:hypothetical protein
MKPILWCGLIILASVVITHAQTIKVPESWDKLAGKADDVVNVNLDKSMMKFASKYMDGEPENEKKLVSKLNGIQVRSLEFKNEGEFTEADVEPIRAQLQGPEWVHMLDVNDKTERESVVIYLKKANDQTLGMVILVEEPKELTFIQLDGPINPNDLSELGGNFGIPKNLPGASKKSDTQSLKAPTDTKTPKPVTEGKK